MSIWHRNQGIFKKVRVGFLNVSVASVLAVSSIGGALPLLLSGQASALQTTAPVITDPTVTKSVGVNSYTITGTMASGTTTIKIYSDANDNGVIDGADAVVASVSSNTGTFSISTPLSSGANNFVVTALKGGQTESTPVNVPTITYTVDTTAPTTPTASPVAGSYNSTQNVTLSSSDAGSGLAGIYYTTNGSTPTNASTLYAGAISVSSSETIKAIAYDVAGNFSSVASFAYVIDAVAPSTPVATPAGGNYAGAQSVSLSSSDTGGSGLASIYYTEDGSPASKINGILYTGPISVNFNETITATAYDAAGNASSLMTENYVIDTTAPSTPVANIPSGTYNSNQSVTLSSSDNLFGSGLQGIYFTTDGSTPTSGSSLYTGAISVTSNTTLNAIAIDNVGNASVVATFTYVIDSVAPATPVASPAGGTYNSTQSVSLSSTDDNSGVVSIYYTEDGSPASSINGILYSGPISVSNSETITATAYDAAGNASSLMTENYVIDTTAPTVTIDDPADGDLLSGSVSITGTVTDANPSATPKAYTVTDSSSTVVATDTDDFSWDTTTANGDGDYTITLVGTDAAGNSASDSVTVTVDNTAPTVTITNPADGSSVSGIVNVSGTVTDAHPGFIFTKFFVITNSAHFPIAFSFSDFNWDTTLLPEGAYTITLSGTDALGNFAQDSATVTVDHTAPVVTVDSQSTTDTTPTITGTVNDSTAAVTVSIDGGAAVAATNNGNGTWSYTVINALAVGSHTVTANAVDPASNHATPANGTATINALPSGGSGGGSGSGGSGSNGGTTVTTTSSNGANSGSGGGSSTDTSDVLGAEDTSANGQTSSASTDQGNSQKNGKHSKNFLGLGWWWLLVLAALLAGIWWALGRRRNGEDEN